MNPRVIKITLAVLVVAAVAVAGFLFLRNRVPAGTYAQVGDQFVTKAEVGRVAEAGAIDRKVAGDLLVSLKRYEIFAKSQKVELSNEDLSAMKTERLGSRVSQFDSNLYSKYVVSEAAWQKRLKQESQGTASGTFFDFPFYRFQPSDYVAKVAQTGNADAIEADRQYAQGKAEEFRNRVEKGEDTNKLLAELKADKRLIGSNTPNRSRQFSQLDFETRQLETGIEEVRSAVLSMSQSGITEIITVKLPKNIDLRSAQQGYGETVKESDKVPMYYFFVKIDTLTISQGENWLAAGLNNIKVKRYE